jgi:Rrf2 family protein
MRIGKTTHNALQILIAAARSSNSLLKGADIARQLNLTEQNTSKIVHLLSRGGFITSVRGPRGGMRLARTPEEIRIGDVVLAMERLTVEDQSLRTGSDTQLFTGVFDDALEAFVAVLNQHTLADIARKKRLGPSALASSAKRPAKRFGKSAKARTARSRAQRTHDFIRSE